jgi:hypothetical protein
MFLNKFHCKFFFFSFENPLSLQDVKLFVRLKKKQEEELSVFENDNSIRLNKNLYKFNHVFDHDNDEVKKRLFLLTLACKQK